MAIRYCHVCDDPIQRGEAKTFMDGLVVHAYCGDGADGIVCEVEACAFWMTTHAGPHLI